MLQYKSTRRTAQNCSPRVVNTCAVCWPRQHATLQHCRPRGAVLPSPLFASHPFCFSRFSSPMATLQLNHIARETADVRRLAAFYEEALGFERVPSPQLPRLPGRLAPPPGDPRRRVPHHRAGPGRRPRLGIPRRAGRAAAQAPPPGVLRGRLRRVRGGAEGARHGTFSSDP